VKSKDFIHGEFHWSKNPIPAPDTFEEGNMVNISPTFKINILNKPRIKKISSQGVIDIFGPCNPRHKISIS